MIKFFRQIRLRLIAENRLSKYLLYAIGEILLVVIGILLALQINNWNENRKLRSIEIKTLKELRSDLKQTLGDIEGDRDYFRTCLSSNEKIVEHMVNKLPYSDSLASDFVQIFPIATFSINTTTFQNIRQSGSNLITNDSLRNVISDFYTRYVNLYKSHESNLLYDHYSNHIKPMLMSAFYTRSNQIVEPRNYEAFINNENYHQILLYNLNMIQNFVGIQTGMINTINRLIRAINSEIKALE